jgi:hypothetical protein
VDYLEKSIEVEGGETVKMMVRCGVWWVGGAVRACG